MPLYTIIEQIEKVANTLRDICNLWIDNPPSKESLNVFNKLLKFQKIFYELFYGFDSDTLVLFAKQKDKIASEISKNKVLLLDRWLSLIWGLNGPLQVLNI